MLSRGVTRAPYILNVTSSVYLYISFLPGRLQHFRLAAGGQVRQHQHTKDTMMMFALLSIHNTYTHRFSSVTGILYGKSSLLTVLRSVLQVGQPKPSLKSSAAMTVHPIYIEFQYMNIILKKYLKSNDYKTRRNVMLWLPGKNCHSNISCTAISVSYNNLVHFEGSKSILVRVTVGCLRNKALCYPERNSIHCAYCDTIKCISIVIHLANTAIFYIYLK